MLKELIMSGTPSVQISTPPNPIHKLISTSKYYLNLLKSNIPNIPDEFVKSKNFHMKNKIL